MASGGAEAIKKCVSDNFDLVFMDHMMPEVDGVEAMKAIKLQNLDAPPIIALTANVGSDIEATFVKEGFNGYLAKPIDMMKLNEVINRFLGAESDTTKL